MNKPSQRDPTSSQGPSEFCRRDSSDPLNAHAHKDTRVQELTEPCLEELNKASSGAAAAAAAVGAMLGCQTEVPLKLFRLIQSHGVWAAGNGGAIPGIN